MRNIVKQLLRVTCWSMIFFGVSNIALAAEPVVLKGISLAQAKNDQAQYAVILELVKTGAANYVIERQDLSDGSQQKIAELTDTQLQLNGFKYVDTYRLKAHGRYKYVIYNLNGTTKTNEKTLEIKIDNIKPVFPGKDFFPVITGNQLTFTLDPVVDAEGDQLEYWLYIRVPGGGAERIIERWVRSSTDQTNKRSTVFSEDTVCEWQLVCIESNPEIERIEKVLVGWTLFDNYSEKH